MASTRKLPSGAWQARAYRDGRRVTVGTYRTKLEATKAGQRAEADVQRGEYVEPSRQTLGAFLAEWHAAVRTTVRATTWASYGDVLRHATERVGEVPLARVDAGRLNALYGDLLTAGRRDGTGGLSPRTVRYVHVVLHRALGDAVRWGRLARNPADHADPPRAQRAERSIWGPQELRTFLAAAADDRLYAAFRLVASTGMRRGEVAGLRWSDLDLDGATAAVTQTRVVIGYTVSESTPKTARGRRVVALDGPTVAALRAHRAAQLAERLAAPAWTETGLVFVRADGTPVHPQYLYTRFRALARRGGLEPIAFHGLRHSHATLALRAGLDTKLVADRLGHASAAFTADTYQQVPRDLARQAAATLAALLDGAAT